MGRFPMRCCAHRRLPCLDGNGNRCGHFRCAKRGVAAGTVRRASELARTHGRAVNRGMRFAIYTETLFKTTNDADNRASVAANSTAELDLVGLGLHGDRKTIDKITGGLKFMA